MNKTHLKFQLRSDHANANGLYPIYLYANINGKVKWFTTNHSLPEKAWNEKNRKSALPVRIGKRSITILPVSF